MISRNGKLRSDKRGQTAVEYVLVLALIVIALIFVFRDARINNAVSGAAGNIQNNVRE